MLLLLLLPSYSLGHGSLIEPPSRAAMHKYGFPNNPVDVDFTQGFCGGLSYQHSAQIGGRFVCKILYLLSYHYLGVAFVEILGVQTQENMRHQMASMPTESSPKIICLALKFLSQFL